MNWLDLIKKHKGRLRTGPAVKDGEEYEYRSAWDSDEDIDAFLDTHHKNIEKSGREIDADGYLTLYFSVKE